MELVEQSLDDCGVKRPAGRLHANERKNEDLKANGDRDSAHGASGGVLYVLLVKNETAETAEIAELFVKRKLCGLTTGTILGPGFSPFPLRQRLADLDSDQKRGR